MNLNQQTSKRCLETIACTLKALLAITSIVLFSSMSYADFHDWRISEIYTNGDSSVQYIVLFANSDGQQNLAGHTISAFDAAGTPGQVFTFPSNLSGSTDQRYLLLATESFELLTGLTADFILPEDFIFRDGGSLDFSSVNVLEYAGFNLPKNGSQALEVLSGSNLPSDPSPTNFFGDTVTVNSDITASFNTETLQLNLPVVDVPGFGLANVTFLLSNDNPVELTLDDFYLYRFGILGGSTAATLSGQILHIPALNVSGVYYELNISLLSDDPIVFGSLEVLSVTEPGAIDETTGEPEPIDVTGTSPFSPLVSSRPSVLDYSDRPPPIASLITIGIMYGFGSGFSGSTALMIN